MEGKKPKMYIIYQSALSMFFSSIAVEYRLATSWLTVKRAGVRDWAEMVKMGIEKPSSNNPSYAKNFAIDYIVLSSNNIDA